MRSDYVLLTGSRNNAGDYLIKLRATELLQAWRPDRTVLDLDGWKPLDDDQVDLINSAQALILTGGPAVRADMRRSVYPLRSDLSDLKVPITTFGVGWSAPDGRWSRTHDVDFTPQTRALLGRIDRDGLQASVRDYHAQNALHHGGVDRTVMTGCPALYDLKHAGRPLDADGPPRHVTVSLGQRFAKSPALARQTEALVDAVRNAFPDAELAVAFHHALGERFVAAYGARTPLFDAQRRFVQWLDERSIGHADVSGSAQAMIDHYADTDLHVGYRVHAHILMTSMRRPSLLLAEDSRGGALREVLGGHVVDAFEGWPDGVAAKVARRLRLRAGDLRAPDGLAEDVIRILTSDQAQGWPRAKQAVCAVEARLSVMERFVRSLP